MKELISIKLQSFSDLITNSSSELFQLRTDKTVEQVSEILSTFTKGYIKPVLFNIEDYRKHRKDFDKLSEELPPYDEWSKYCERRKELISKYPEYYLYNTLDGWFFDERDKDDLYFLRFIYASRDYTPIRSKFIKYLIENDGFENNNDLWFYNVKSEIAEKFFATCKFPKDLFKSTRLKNIEKLNGCILLLSINDNSIPYSTFDQINKLFNGTNYHLG